MDEVSTTNNTVDGPAALNAFLTLEALAEALGVNKQVVHTWRRERGLPAIRLGSRTYFQYATVAAWLRAQEAVANPAETD